MQAYLLVGLGGAMGAMGRYGFSPVRRPVPQRPVSARHFRGQRHRLADHGAARSAFWRATTPGWQPEARLLVAVGVLGGFTTFSSFSLDVVTLIERGNLATAALYAVASMIVAILALFVGLWIARSVF